jgi:histidyl-tRNA synthetase
MKCIQIDKVYRAERPQKGRDREFVQCDIDIIGSESINSEIELIYTTAKALISLGINDFTIKLNDRRLLKSFLLAIGINDDQIDSVCISIDKLDKIGIPGLANELKEKDVNENSINKLLEIISSQVSLERIAKITGETNIIEGLQNILNSISKLSAFLNGSFDIRFDLTLVRGQGYYTGTIFEIESNRYSSSIGGGGRYDNLIGKFTGEHVPAVGFSIGFERIFSLLIENGFEIPSAAKRIAVIYQNENFLDAYKDAEQYREQYDVALYEMPKKLGKFLDKLLQDGFYGFLVYGQGN